MDPSASSSSLSSSSSSSSNLFFTAVTGALAAGCAWWLLSKWQKHSERRKTEKATDDYLAAAYGTPSSSSSITKKKDTAQEDPSLAVGPRISQILLYPVKGCGAMSVKEWPVTDDGLLFDREWALVKRRASEGDDGDDKSSGVLLPLPFTPSLVTVRPQMVNGFLTLTKEGVFPVTVPLRPPQPEEEAKVLLRVRLNDVEGDAVEVSEKASEWFSSIVGYPVQLVRSLPKTRRPKDHTLGLHPGVESATDSTYLRFQKFSHFLVVTEEAMAWLRQACPTVQSKTNGEIEAEPAVVVSGESMRANLVLSGLPYPEDDKMKRIKIVLSSSSPTAAPPLVLEHSKFCGRCTVVSNNPATGKVHPKMEPTATLRRLRQGPYPHQVAVPPRGNEGKPQVRPFFGNEFYLNETTRADLQLHRKTSENYRLLRVGDRVEIEETQSPPVFSSCE